VRRRTWALGGVGVLIVATAVGGVVAASGASAAPAPEAPVTTAPVERGDLADLVSLDGILTYGARPDGSPYAVVNQARGTFTELPDAGAEIDCGGLLYRVDDHPVLMLCGAVPAYRDLRRGAAGNDVRQLNQNLHALGYGTDPGDEHFTARTQRGLEGLQRDRGAPVTGGLDVGAVVVLPDRVRIAQVVGQLGGAAQSGAPVAQATSGTLEVQVGLAASQRDAVAVGDAARITLPGNVSETGRVDRLGTVAQLPDGQDARSGEATVPARIGLDHPERAGGLDQAPVRVDITTAGVRDVLSVPVTALVGRSGGGFAVEVVRDGGRRELVAVTLGLVDATAGRVQVEGGLAAGDAVVVPAL
jgi:peptidoglycan hydrolase-like protein with peptidoglycan-binding domain